MQMSAKQAKNNMLTVIIPVYNREKELVRCLDSIAAQTLRPSRLIVVDDGSTDGSALVARNHRIGAEVVEGDHRGASAARNIGLDMATTPWTMFFDSDDIMSPTHIESAMCLAGDDVDIVGWDFNRVSLRGGHRVLPFVTKDIAYQNIMHGALSTLHYMCRTELFRKAGKWNPEISVWDDIELGARLLALNPRIVKKPDITVTTYVTEQSITGTKWADKTDKFIIALDTLGRTLNKCHKDWVDLKTAILAADIIRENRDDGRRMLSRIEPMTLAVRLAYLYRFYGGRGTARLFRPFFSKDQ